MGAAIHILMIVSLWAIKMYSVKATNLAVLIDAQNIPSAMAPRIFANIEAIGASSIRLAYGDWSDQSLKGWKSCLHRYAIRPVQQFCHVAGKNAADMALIIDAMDLLHSGRHDGFCIVSSDSDFSSLAVRIRQQAVMVYGLGRSNTPASFTTACDRFIVLDEPLVVKAQAHPPVQTKSISLPSKEPLTLSDLNILKEAIRAKVDGTGWADVAAVGSHLAQQSKFTVRKHATKLSRLLRVSGIADLSPETALSGQQMKVGLR